MSLGEEIRRRRKELKLSQQELGKLVGLDSGNISRIERNKQGLTQETLRKTARALQCEVHELFQPPSPSNVTPIHLKQGRRVPLIRFDQLYNWLKHEDPLAHLDAACVFKHTDLDNLSMNSFSLEINNKANFPEFTPGDHVFIDPSIPPSPGDFVAVHNEIKEEALFLKYRPRGLNEKGQDVFELVPLNEDYPSLRSDLCPLQIIGVMVEHRRYRKKNTS